jgi:curved DNA-binding protein CbpA
MPITEELIRQLNLDNYYERLGLSQNATEADITKAYRKLALQTHPDRNNSDGTYFKKLTEAYEVLSDSEKKTRYDIEHPPIVNAPPTQQDTSSLSTSMNTTEDVDTLEKINNFISKIERDIPNIPYLGAIEPNQQFSKIKLKQDKFYLFNQSKFSALDKAVRKFLMGVKSDIEFFLKKNKIILQDPSLLKIDISQENLEVSYQKIISATEDIKKQIQEAFELLKSKIEDPEVTALCDECINRDTNRAFSENLSILSDFVKSEYDYLSQDTSFLEEFKLKVKKLYKDKSLSPMEKLRLFITEIENFEHQKTLNTKIDTLSADPRYSKAFKENIALILVLQIPPDEKIKQISQLEIAYQEKYILDNNVEEIYELLKKKFPEFKKTYYMLAGEVNQNQFSKTYEQVKKLESFFQKIYKYYEATSPYRENEEFMSALGELKTVERPLQEKFDSLSWHVRRAEESYISGKIKAYESLHVDLFGEVIERPPDLTMTNFLKFYNSLIQKIEPGVQNFINKLRKQTDFLKNNSSDFNVLNQNFSFYTKPENIGSLSGLISKLKNAFEQYKEETIKERLAGYKKRIETFRKDSGEIDYEHDFRYFIKSRGINRKINYLIADKLLKKLSKAPQDFSIFEKILEYKLEIVQKLTEEEKKYYVDRGIKSSELNQIIDDAVKLSKN